MSKPTAKQLLINAKDHGLLASRVEKVLAYCKNARTNWAESPEREAAEVIGRLLDGEDA